MATTPGPWGVLFDSCLHCGGEWVITGPPSGAHGQFANEADARLIAAAPEMYEVLKAIAFEGAGGSFRHLTSENAAKALAAIAKAEGTTHA